MYILFFCVCTEMVEGKKKRKLKCISLVRNDNNNSIITVSSIQLLIRMVGRELGVCSNRIVTLNLDCLFVLHTCEANNMFLIPT